jgi:hypothetical protein
MATNGLYVPKLAPPSRCGHSDRSRCPSDGGNQVDAPALTGQLLDKMIAARRPVSKQQRAEWGCAVGERQQLSPEGFVPKLALMVQEVGFSRLQELGVKLIAADSPTAFLDDTPTAKLVRQLLGAVSEFDKTMLVAKLKAARDRKLAKGQKCGGRKSYSESNPPLVALAKQLASERKSLRKISAELAAQGHVTPRGLAYSASAVKAMLSAPSLASASILQASNLCQ